MVVFCKISRRCLPLMLENMWIFIFRSSQNVQESEWLEFGHLKHSWHWLKLPDFHIYFAKCCYTHQIWINFWGSYKQFFLLNSIYLHWILAMVWFGTLALKIEPKMCVQWTYTPKIFIGKIWPTLNWGKTVKNGDFSPFTKNTLVRSNMHEILRFLKCESIYNITWSAWWKSDYFFSFYILIIW